MLIEALKEVINPETIFIKANGALTSYTFYDWAIDHSQFRYTVHHKGGDTHKRVKVNELRSLLEHCQAANEQTITRALYKSYCPTAASDGWCGFTIVANVVQLLCVGDYESASVVKIVDRARLRELLDHL